MTTWMYWDGPRAMSAALELCVESIRRHNPDARLVGDAEIAELGGEEVLSPIAGRKPWEKADVLRLWLLHRFGGQWIDCDSVCLRRLDWLELTGRHDLIGFGYRRGRGPWFSNAVLAAPAGSPPVKAALDRALKIIRAAGDKRIPYGETGQALLRGAENVRRFERWRLMYVPHARAGRFARRALEKRHELGPDWNPNAWLYHLTGKGLAPFRDWTRGQLLRSPALLSFLLRKSRGEVRPLRAAEIAARLPADRPAAGVEVGVFDGLTARVVLQQRPLLSWRLVDPWETHAAGSRYRRSGDRKARLGAERWSQAEREARRNVRFAADRAEITKVRSLAAARATPDGSLDLVFLDADHSYQGVREDIAAWAPKLKAGGWLGGHDYGNPNFPGVRRAVDEFCAAAGLAVETGRDRTWFARLDPPSWGR